MSFIWKRLLGTGPSLAGVVAIDPPSGGSRLEGYREAYA